MPSTPAPTLPAGSGSPSRAADEAGGWRIPRRPWVLHSTPELGQLTERWIDVQVTAGRRLEGRLIGNALAPGAERRPHHLMATDRLDVRAAYGLMVHSRGQSMRWLARVMAANPPRAVHVHFGLHGVFHLPLAQALGRPLVTSFYGADAASDHVVQDPTWRRRYARLFAGGDAFFAEGPAMAARLHGLGCPEDKTRVIRLPADAEGLEGIEHRPGDDLTVVMAGRFCEKKGFGAGVRAFARALRGRKDARLLLVGGGPLEADLRRLVAEERLDGQVEFAGRLPFREFMSRIATARLMLHPSRTAADGDAEGGAPVTLIEGQWLGVPALVSDHDDLPFAAAPEGSVTLPALDEDAWAEALRELSHDPERLVRMGAAARSFAREHHAPRVNAEAREAVYDA